MKQHCKPVLSNQKTEILSIRNFTRELTIKNEMDIPDIQIILMNLILNKD